MPKGFTAKTSACRLSLYVPRNSCTLSSAEILSRSASVARTLPGAAKARMPTCSSVGEYHTSTSVLSCAARPSVGKNCENPVSTAASAHAGSSNLPSTTTAASRRGVVTVSSPRRPWNTAPA